jgi:cell wall assembly regulator SMI1
MTPSLLSYPGGKTLPHTYHWPYTTDGTNPPADPHEIDALEQALNISLPTDLRAFYKFSNGFNGELDHRKNYARIHPLAEILSATTGYDVAAEFRLTLIGDNGGNYVFALDHTTDQPRYIALSLLAAARDELTELGKNFSEFLASLAAGQT